MLVFTALNISLQKVLIMDRTNNDKYFFYLFLDHVDGYIEENDRIKYLVFASTERNKEAFKSYIKLSKESKR